MQGRFVLFVVAVVVSYTAAEMGAGGPVEHENSLTTEFSKDKLARVLSAYGSNEQVAKIVSLSMEVDSEAKYEVVFETASGKTCSASWFEIPSNSEVPQGTQLSCKSKRSVPATFDEYEKADNSLTTEFSKDKLARVLSAYGSNEQVAKIVSLSMEVDSEAKYEVVFETVSGKTCSASWFEIPSKSEVPQGTQLSCKSKRSVPATFDEYEMADNSLTTEFSKDKLARVLSAYGSNEQVAKIVSLSMQVDSEAKYEVVFETASGKTCSASWFEIPSKSDVPQGTQLSCKSKRSAPGSFEDVDEYEMADMVAYGESLANEGVNGYRKAVVKIVKAQKQVVYGTIYKINYILKTTACKMDDLPTGDCLGKEVAQRESCESSIYVSPYMIHGRYQHKVMSNECKAVVGGKFVTGHDQEDMEYAMHFAVSHVNMQINTMTYKGLYKVLSTDEKLSAGGKLYTFKFIVRDTDCMKNENLPLNSENCPIKTEKENHSADDVCSVTVWYSPSTKQVHVRSSACASASFF